MSLKEETGNEIQIRKEHGPNEEDIEGVAGEEEQEKNKNEKIDKQRENKRSKGGAVIAIKKEITHRRLNIGTTLEIVALERKRPKKQ